MLQSIWDDVRNEFSIGNMINKIIIVNVVIWMTISVVWVLLRLFNGMETPELYSTIVDMMAVSHDWKHMLFRPWTVITHMFFHEAFFHLLWNMLYLFWFGRIFGDLLGDHRVLPLYITGGLAGFAAYFLAYNLTGLGAGPSIAYGASGAVFCVVTAIGVYVPDYPIRLFFLGTIRLKYLVFFAIFAQILALGTMDNIGGTIDHIGGIIMGFLFVFYLKRGSDLTQPVGKALNWVTKSWQNLMKPSPDHKQRSGPRAAYRAGKSVKETATKTRPSFMRKAGGKAKGQQQSDDAPTAGMSHQEQLDAILDKIKDKGYNSLSKEEKDFLFRASNQK